MYNGIGLSTPRGSGTNGYVQKNSAFLPKSRLAESSQKSSYDNSFYNNIGSAPPGLMQREPNKEILEHDRKRQVEVKCLELQIDLEDQGYVTLYANLIQIIDIISNTV
jgi:serine/arginine repetitive matrix protein 2